MKVDISNFLSETGDSSQQYVVSQKGEDGYIVKSVMVSTLEEAQKIKKDWEKQLIIIQRQIINIFVSP